MENKNHIFAYGMIFILIGIVLGSPFEVVSEGYYRTITIDSDYIDSNLMGFPLLVVLDNTTGDYNFHNNGADIRFTSSDFSVNFSYEISLFNNSGKTYCWVNVSESILSISDYVFCVTYNNANLSDGQNVIDVWDSSYLAVWHLNDLLDSTSNNIDLTNDGAVGGVVGKIGFCYDFEFDDVDCLYHNTFLDSGFDVLSVECWSKHESDTNGNYISKRNIAGQDRLFFRRDVGNLNFFLEGSNSGNKVVNGGAVSVGAWHYGYGSYEKGATLKVILNTTLSSGNIQSNSFLGGTADHFLIGKLNSVANTNAMDGLIDEVRVSSVLRNASWIKACYHSQNQTNGFLTIGTEQTL